MCCSQTNRLKKKSIITHTHTHVHTHTKTTESVCFLADDSDPSSWPLTHPNSSWRQGSRPQGHSCPALHHTQRWRLHPHHHPPHGLAFRPPVRSPQGPHPYHGVGQGPEVPAGQRPITTPCAHSQAKGWTREEGWRERSDINVWTRVSFGSMLWCKLFSGRSSHSVQFSSRCVCALGKVRMCSAPSLRVDHLALPLSTPLSSTRSVVWCPWLCACR